MNTETQDKVSPWATNPFLITLRWIGFLPVGFVLSFLLNMLVMLAFTWMTDNNGKLLIKDFFFEAYPLFGLFLAGMAAAGIAALAANIAPKPRIGAMIYGVLYLLFSLKWLYNLYHQDYVSKVVATVVVIGIIIGSAVGVISVCAADSKTDQE